MHFPELRSNMYTAITPNPPAPPHPAQCLHLTHSVFDPMPHTTDSPNESFARGDTISTSWHCVFQDNGTSRSAIKVLVLVHGTLAALQKYRYRVL